MQSVLKFMRRGALLFFVLTAPLLTQQVRVKLQNGAVFRGRVLSETPDELQLDLGRGHILLHKNDIATREVVLPPKKSDEENSDGDKAENVAASSFQRFLKLLKDRGDRDASVGSRAIATTVDLRKMPMPPGTPEEAVSRFVQAVIHGQVNQAFTKWCHPEFCLQEAFPHLVGGLTTYSRRRAAIALSALFQAYFADPAVAAELKKASPTIRTVREEGSVAIVEMKLGQFEGEEVIALLRLHENRIVSFSQLAKPVNALVRKIENEIREARMSSSVLVPILEESLRRMRPEEKSNLAKVPPEKAVKIVEEAGGFEIKKPESWIALPRSEIPSFARLVLKDPSGRAFVMVITEDFSADLGEFERAARANLARASSSVNVRKRETLRVSRREALRFDAEATVDQVPLSYSYLLVPTPTRAYQVIVWTLKKERHRFARALNGAIKSFQVLDDARNLTGSSLRGRRGVGSTQPGRKDG